MLAVAGGVVAVVAAARAVPPGPGRLQVRRVDVEDGVGQAVLGDDAGGGQVLDQDGAQALRCGGELVGPGGMVGGGVGPAGG